MFPATNIYPFPKKTTPSTRYSTEIKLKLAKAAWKTSRQSNNHNMNIFHQNKGIKDECNCRNKNYFALGGKCLSPNVVYQGKITSTQPNNNDKVNFRVLKKSFQDSTNTSNPLPVKITRMIQNC